MVVECENVHDVLKFLWKNLMNCTCIEDNKHKNAGDLILIYIKIELVAIDQLHRDVVVGSNKLACLL